MWRWRMDTGHKDEWKQGVKFYLATCYLMFKLVLRLCRLIIWPPLSWFQRAFRSTKHVVVGVLELLWASRGGLWYCTLMAILMTYHRQDMGSAFDSVLLHGRFASANQRNYPDLGSDVSSAVEFLRFSQTSFLWENRSNDVVKCRLFSQAKKRMLTI